MLSRTTKKYKIGLRFFTIASFGGSRNPFSPCSQLLFLALSRLLLFNYSNCDFFSLLLVLYANFILFTIFVKFFCIHNFFDTMSGDWRFACPIFFCLLFYASIFWFSFKLSLHTHTSRTETRWKTPNQATEEHQLFQLAKLCTLSFDTRRDSFHSLFVSSLTLIHFALLQFLLFFLHLSY